MSVNSDFKVIEESMHLHVLLPFVGLDVLLIHVEACQFRQLAHVGVVTEEPVHIGLDLGELMAEEVPRLLACLLGLAVGMNSC